MAITKHIEKRFLFQKQLTAEEAEHHDKDYEKFKLEDLSNIKKIPNPGEFEALLLTDQNVLLKAFPVKDDNGKHRFIPEPDPILIYFHTAYMNYRQIAEKRKEIFTILSDSKISESLINQLYDFFSLTNTFIIMSFTAVEAFINKSIPETFIYKKTDKRKTELYTKEQIERYLSFNEKRDVLDEVAGKSFAKAHPSINRFLDNLKDFRDSIVHTKAATDGYTKYDYLYKKALNYRYKETLNAVADFCNYYCDNNDYLKNCSCDQTW